MPADHNDVLVQLKAEVDTSGIDRAREAFDALTRSVTEANKALAQLAGQPHGGIAIKAVGQIMTCEVRPPPV